MRSWGHFPLFVMLLLLLVGTALVINVRDTHRAQQPPLAVVPQTDPADRWVCSHATKTSVLVMTGAGALQGYVDVCDEWRRQ